MPYPPSKDLVGWEYKSGCNPGYGSGGNVKGASADTFFPSWAADGNLYTGFTDGHVVDDATGSASTAKSEGSAPLYTVTHGQAAIVGDDPFALNITKVKTFSNQSGKNTSSLPQLFICGAFLRGCLRVLSVALWRALPWWSAGVQRDVVVQYLLRAAVP